MSAKYKNKKNFINLCYREKDFGIYADWHFFAFSHGKCPNDGIREIVKKLAAKANLQRIAEPTATLKTFHVFGQFLILQKFKYFDKQRMIVK